MSRGKRNAKGRFVPDTEPDIGAGNLNLGTESIVIDDPIQPGAVDPNTVAGSSGSVGDSGGDDNSDGDTAEQQPRRRRGRPPGSGTKGKTGAYPLNVRGLEKLLVGIHGGIAMLLSSPGFALDTEMKVFDGKSESEFLSQSIADVARHYNPRVFEQKTIDWSNLIQCLALVYGPRLYNARSEMRANKMAKQAQQPRPTPQPTRKPVDPQPAATSAANGHDWTNEQRTGEIPGIGNVVVPKEFLQ